ncbi:hypothetical protein ACFSNA_08010 [Pedobacter mendelii]|uniref:hypothetical protein n=1 Tax=Pedobacter mendelii TaxID=1908240 RepID=UPI00362F8463
MKSSLKIIFLLMLLNSGLFAQSTLKPPIETGVSFSLAKSRKAIIDNIFYKFNFNIPADKGSEIVAAEEINFELKDLPSILQLDFKQDARNIKSISVNGKVILVNLQNEHLLFDKKNLLKGLNKIEIQFIAGNESLNRNTDYLYALFVPDHARTVFPCFDQPDLKAIFELTLTVPKDWKVLANGIKKDSVVSATNTTYHFANSNKLSTYLFSFAAGKFNTLKKN